VALKNLCSRTLFSNPQTVHELTRQVGRLLINSPKTGWYLGDNCLSVCCSVCCSGVALFVAVSDAAPSSSVCCSVSDNVFSKDALLSHIRERKRTGIPLNSCLVGRRVVPTAR